jgi:hypothetical protein
MEVSGELHAPVALPPEEESPISTGQGAGCVLRAGLDDTGTAFPLMSGPQPVPALMQGRTQFKFTQLKTLEVKRDFK